MGHYDGSKLPLWNVAQKYVLADNFFMGAFGGSFLNHFWLICACAPQYPDADKSPAKDSIAAVERDGVTLKIADNSPKSALDGMPKFVNDGSLTPDFYAVNTMQPPYQPSANKPARGRRSRLCRPGEADHPAAADREHHRRSVSAPRASAGPGMPAPGRPRSTARTRRRCRTSSITISRSTISPTWRRAPRRGPSI